MYSLRRRRPRLSLGLLLSTAIAICSCSIATAASSNRQRFCIESAGRPWLALRHMVGEVRRRLPRYVHPCLETVGIAAERKDQVRETAFRAQQVRDDRCDR